MVLWRGLAISILPQPVHYVEVKGSKNCFSKGLDGVASVHSSHPSHYKNPESPCNERYESCVLRPRHLDPLKKQFLLPLSST